MDERCDYRAVAEMAPWLVETELPMVISCDLDGILSAMLLQATLGWRVVGYYNGETLWLQDEARCIYRDLTVFVDHDINREEIPSIGHHMLQWGPDTPPGKLIQSSSVNPNILRGVNIRDGWQRKYPFGTLHFLLACFNSLGLLTSHIVPGRDFVPVLLQVDSVIESAVRYPQNVLDWLAWLGSTERDSPLYPLCRVVLATSAMRLVKEKAALEKWIAGVGRGRQAAIVDPVDPSVMARLHALVSHLARVTGWPGNFPDFSLPDNPPIIVKMERRSTRPTKAEYLRVVTEKEPFSFAIISSRGDRGLNFTEENRDTRKVLECA